MTLPETLQPAAPSYRTLALVSIGVGALLVAGSMCAGVIFLLVPVVQAQRALATNTSVVSIGALALGYGALLVLIGRGLLRDNTGARFRLPSPFFFLIAFFVALLIGQAILTLNIATAYLFPAWHVFASLLVPMIVLAFAVRRLPPVSVRSVMAQFSWGGLVTIALAAVFELVIGGVLVGLAIIAIMIVIGTERVRELGTALQSAAGDPQRLFQIITAEPLAVVIGAMTAVLLIVLIVPLLEEILKATGPAILISRRVRANMMPTKGEALLWGLAAGAGYAFTENMFNAQGALSGTGGVVGFWAAAMLLRAGTSLLHMIATATVAVGWYQALVDKKTVRLLLLGAAATSAHAAWNSGAVLLGSVSLLEQAGGNWVLASTVLTGAVLLFLVLLFVLFLYWLVRLVRWAQSPVVEIVMPRNVTGLEIENARQVR